MKWKKTYSSNVSDDFHARFSALTRSYRYVLLNDAVRPAADQGRVGWFHSPLDVDTMKTAAVNLLGEHDFTAFRSAECQARSPVRTMHAVSVVANGPYVFFEFTANAFLHHMIRNIVGSLVYVGNLASAIEAALLHPAAPGKTFLVSDGAPVSTAQLVSMLASALEVSDRSWPLPPALLQFAGTVSGKRGEVDRLIDSLAVDDSAIRRDLGWMPPFSMSEGLRETAIAFRASFRTSGSGRS